MNSFISWIGGKKLLRNEIVSRFPEKFDRYVEVFGGAGWVLFHKDKHADQEIFNDYNGDLVNLYRCVKYHEPELKRELSYMLNSRELFNDFKAQYDVIGLTDIQRAARYFMLIKTSYGSKMSSFGCVKKNINAMIDYLDEIQERLSRVVIENRDFEDLIKIYDRPGTLFYLDPPYYGTERYYQVQFSEVDHLRLKKCLERIQGNFVISYNDCEFTENLYSSFKIEKVLRNHNLNARYIDGDRSYNEIIVMKL